MAAKKRKKPCDSIFCGIIGQGVLKALIMLLLGLAGYGYFIHQMVNSELKSNNFSQAKLVAEDVAENLAERLKFYQQLLTGLAKDPNLPGLFRDFDVAQVEISARQQQLELLIPGVREILLLPFDWDELHVSEGVALSYASLDLLRQVEKSGQVSSAQVHQFRLPQQHVALVVPVLDEKGSVVGTMHAAFPVSVLRRFLPTKMGMSMRLELQQVVGDKPWSMTSVGNGAMLSNGNFVPVKGTIWHVAYEDIESELSLAQLLLLLGALGMVFIVCVFVMLAQLQRIRAAMKNDQAQIIRLVDNMLNKQRIQAYVAEVGEFQNTIDLLGQMAMDARENEEFDQSNYVIEEGLSDKPKTRQFKPSATASTFGQQVDNKGIIVEEISHEEEVEEIAEKRVPESAKNPVVLKEKEEDEDKVPADLFNTYDISGNVVEDFIPENVYEIGRAIGSAATDKKQSVIIIGRDGRDSSAELSAALSRGLIDSGRDVIDLGMVPLPVLYFATHYLDSKSGVMVGGGLGSLEENRLQIILNGKSLFGQSILDLKDRINQGNLTKGRGAKHEQNLAPDYLEKITTDVQLMRTMKVVVDCANGVVGSTAPDLFEQLGCDVVPLFCEVDGSFPNRGLDVSKTENLKPLIAKVKEEKAVLGIAFEPDGTGFVVIDSSGKTIWADRLLMLFARDILSRQPGADVVYDVKSTRHLATDILSQGGRPVMWKTGHALIKSKMRKTKALLGGEMSGHIFIKERWSGVDDGLYAVARLLEILSADERTPTEIFAQLPESIATPEIRIQLPKSANHKLMKVFVGKAMFPGAKIIKIDGLRAEFEDGWGLMRASCSSDALVLRFEADTQTALVRIQKQFRDQLKSIDQSLSLPF